MSLNCNEINLIIDELNIEGAFIQDIIQPGFDSIAFYTYKEGVAKTILICTAQNGVRINETRKKITKNDKPLRFMEYLRSNIKGCRINSFKQMGMERVIKCDISHSEDESYTMYIRLWNNAANIIVCDPTDLVLETMFRRPERYEVKGEYFIPPAIDEEKIKNADKFPIREWKDQFPENVDERNKSFNSFIDYWYSEHASTVSREALLVRAEKWYQTSLSKQESALKNLEEKVKSFENAPLLKHQGDLILSYGYLIDKDSDNKYLECEDYDTGKTVRLLIDPKLSPQENASIYYKNYKKAVSGAEDLTNDIEIAKKRIDKLNTLYEEIKNEQNPVKIEQLLRRDSKPKQQQKKTHPGLDYTVDGWYILVGRDANENDELLRHHVRGQDLWLHVRDFPGGYVFIKARKDKTVPLNILLDAANLAVYYSKARNAGKTDLYYTHVKYLRRAKNGPKGLVLPTQEKNLCITPDKKILARLNALHEEQEL